MSGDLKRMFKRVLSRPDRGSTLVAGVIMLSYFTLFGAAMMARMILDANSSTGKIVATRTFYLADSGIRWGRKYLVTNTANVTLGPISYGGGTLQVIVTQTSIKLNAWNNNQNVYHIVSTATLGNTSRSVEEFRYRGGGSNKQMIFWREVVL
jgi:Tfp pilus assembly protein PilX